MKRNREKTLVIKESGYRNTAGSMPAVFHIMHAHIRERFNFKVLRICMRTHRSELSRQLRSFTRWLFYAAKVGTFAARVRALTPPNVHRTFSGALFTLHPQRLLVLLPDVQ